MLHQNPFDASFSSIPPVYLSTTDESNRVINTIKSAPSGRSFFITGVRGSGKTVLMRYIEKQLKTQKDYLVISLENNQGLLTALYQELLSQMHPLSEPLLKRFGNLSFDKLNLKLDDGQTNIGNNVNTWLPILTPMLEQLKHQHKKLIVTIDEVTNSTDIQQFAQLFNNLKSHNLPIFTIMTGLPNLVDEVRNEDRLTFLLRSVRIVTQPLSQSEITAKYQQVFACSWLDAAFLTKRTDGYPYAFQLLGDLIFQELQKLPKIEIKAAWMHINQQFKAMLFENAYAKIFEPLPRKLQQYLQAATLSPYAASIRQQMQATTNQIAQLRSRLLKRRLIAPDGYGRIKIILPYFAEYVTETMDESSLFYLGKIN